MRGWFRRRRFAKAFRQTLDAKKADLDPQEYTKSRAATYDSSKMKTLMGQLQTTPGLKGGIQDWDWDSILAWINDFLLPLIKTLLPLLVLMDEE